MSVIRVKHQDNYVIIQKSVLEDPNLSFKAKGLWAYCMSRPNHWEFHVSHLAKVSKEGRDAIYSAINELEEQGYVKKVQRRSNGRFVGFDYEVSEIKIILPLTGFPLTANPLTANPQLVSIDVKQGMTSSSPSSEKSKEPERCYTKEEEEFFSKRMKEIPKPPKYISPAYKKKVISGMKNYQGCLGRVVESRRIKCKALDGKRVDGVFISDCMDCVQFTEGSYFRSVRYDTPEEEWKEQTHRWIK